MQFNERKRSEERREEKSKIKNKPRTVYQRREHQRQPESHEMRNAYACTFGLLDFVLNGKQKRSSLNAHSSTLAAWIQFDIVDFSIVSHWNYNSDGIKTQVYIWLKKTKKLKWKRDGLMGLESGKNATCRTNQIVEQKKNQQMERKGTHCEKQQEKKKHIRSRKNGTKATAPPSNIYNNFSYKDIVRSIVSHIYKMQCVCVYPERPMSVRQICVCARA